MRLTSRGYGLLVAGALLVLAGFGFGYRELAEIGAAGIVAVAGALAFVAWRPQLTVRRQAEPDRLMRGETSRVTLNIVNASRFFGTSLVARDRIRPGGSVPVPLMRLRPGRVTEVTYPVPTSRRGLIEIGPLEISRRDPLGLVGVVRGYGDTSQVWVRPKVHPIAAVPVGLSRSMDGRIDRVPHGSITFAALREYVIGDDLRHVHWRTSARVGELMVREHVDTSLPRVVLLVDDRVSAHTSEGLAESTFEAVCEAAASVIVAAFREDIHVVVRFVSGSPGAHGHAEVGPLLDVLAEAELTDRGSVPGAVESLRARRVGDTLLYLTGPPHEEDLGAVAGLRGAYPSIIAAVFGPIGFTEIAGLLVVAASDGADFASAWDGVRAW